MVLFFKLDQKDEHLALKEMELGLFKIIIFSCKYDPFIGEKFYRFLNSELDEKEAFRRMLTFTKQLSQKHLENVKSKFKASKKTKFGIYENVLGGVECRDRCSPRMHLPNESSFSNFIEKSNYMNIIKHKDFMAALASNGITLNRVLSVVLILGLEEDTSRLELLTPADVCYLAKVLLKIISPYPQNHLPWIETSERHFLEKHYEREYFAHFTIFISKLKHESLTMSEPAAMISRRPLPATYPQASKDHLIFSEKGSNDVLIEEYVQNCESAAKRLVYGADLQDMDGLSSLELVAKLKQLETHV
jgi:hypothetical protein